MKPWIDARRPVSSMSFGTLLKSPVMTNGMPRPASTSRRPAIMRQLTGPTPSPLFKYKVPSTRPPCTTAA
eukprot:8402718-Lingulodinium_polyedra.AAC.1